MENATFSQGSTTPLCQDCAGSEVIWRVGWYPFMWSILHPLRSPSSDSIHHRMCWAGSTTGSECRRQQTTFRQFRHQDQPQEPHRRSLSTVYSRYITVVYITELDISWLHVGSHFFGPQERDTFTKSLQLLGPNSQETIFREICSPRWPLFQVCRRQFFAKSSQAYLSMRAGTHAVWWSATIGGALTPPLCRRVGDQLIQYQCKSRLQIVNLSINNAFLIKSALFDHTVYICHLVQTLRQFHSKSRVRDW